MLDYGLTTRELMTYAIVYGFCQSGENRYYASLNTLSQWLGINNSNHALDHLKSLEEKGLIIKSKSKPESGQICCEYYTTCEKTLLPEEDPTCDYITIQPFMIQELALRNAELLLYAVIYSYSRKGSGNYCSYNKTYMAKWLKCRKDNVAIYIKKLKDRQLIKEVAGRDGLGFIAVIPENENTEDPKKRSTSLKTGNPKNRSTLPKKRSTNSLKNVDNNLYNNLLDNLDISLNNNSNSDSNKIPSKDSLSVVVNRNIFPDTFMFDYEKRAFDFKEELDQRLFKKYSCKDIDVAEFMSKYAETLFRMMLASWPDSKDYAERISDLLLDIATDRHFSKKAKQINSLSQQKAKNLYDAADELLDPNSGKYIRKSKKAYMIGVLDNILESQ